MSDLIRLDGRRLYEARTHLGLSLRAASDMLGWDKSTLCRYEQADELMLSTERVQDLYRVYGIQTAEPGTAAGADTVLDEEEIVLAYRKLDNRERRRVSRILIRAMKDRERTDQVEGTKKERISERGSIEGTDQ